MRTVQVTTPTGHTITVLARMHIYDIIRMYPDEFPSDGHPFIVCTVNNELTSLSEKVGVNCTLVPYSVATTDGAECYRRSLIFALGKVWSELFPKTHFRFLTRRATPTIYTLIIAPRIFRWRI